MNLPIVDFIFREGGEFVTRTSKEIFSGKRVVVFALPGAFTPTCTEQQLPGFEAAYDEIKGYGVDEVYCLSVNDAFVMNAWFDSLGITKVKALPDGNGAFTASAGMAVQKTNLGFAVRSWRYAIVVNNGELEWSGVEEGKRDNASDDPCEASTPQCVIQYLEAKRDADAAPAETVEAVAA
jgi:peroxiredoxin